MTLMPTVFEVNETLGYSQAARVGGFLFISGQVAMDEQGNLVGRDDIWAQTGQVFANLRRMLETGGSSLDQVVKLTIFVTRLEYLAMVREIRKRVFGPLGFYPASTAVVVSSLARPEWMVEVEAIATVRDAAGG
ncbi:MAG: RidA family protein [Armatimonadota bacterium]|nr:RidA family protein [Armatimonadota bacterium]MDR7533095.1 RidA family protein [Armatimonadota bacterium]MDR7535873.1 RidA family protein [Armatimonadota bacterium]